VVVNSNAMHAHMLEEGVGADRLHLVHNGIDLTVFHPGRRQIINGPCVVGSVCVLRPEKDLQTLLEAFARARARVPMQLLFVGDGPERNALGKRAARLGVADAVRFAGGTADVVPWLRSIDVFVLPSLSEALSNALMEAMACGCCCVASRVGGNPELIDDGTTGRLFPAGDAQALAQILLELAQQPALRTRLAAAAATRIAHEFTLSTAAAEMAACYEFALARVKTGHSR
jgi:glycosyltransferase involved in cell wall biosynthesis